MNGQELILKAGVLFHFILTVAPDKGGYSNLSTKTYVVGTH